MLKPLRLSPPWLPPTLPLNWRRAVLELLFFEVDAQVVIVAAAQAQAPHLPGLVVR